MSAATELTAAAPASDVLAPLGVPVIRGRLNLGRSGPLVTPGAAGGRLVLVAGLRTACWLGPPAAAPPDLGRLAHRGVAEVDGRGRVVLDRRARAWLDVADPSSFSVVPVPVPAGGLLLVPVEDFDRRWEEVRADERLAG